MNRLIVLLLLQIPLSYSYETDFITNYLEIQKARRVVVFTCWHKKINMDLLQLSNNFSLNLQQSNWKIDTNMLRQETVIITDTKCSQFPHLLQDANRLDLFKTRLKWLILNFNNRTLLAGNLNILIDSQVTVAAPIDEKQLELHLIYKIHKNHTDYVRNFMGIYAIDEKHFVELNNFTFAKNRTNLQRSLLRISYILTQNDSINHLYDYRDKHIDSVSKISYTLLHPILDQLNITKLYTLRRIWGNFNGTTRMFDDGMLHDLQTEKADIGGTCTIPTIERFEIVLCYSMYAPNNLRFILRAPPLSYVENIATLPFQTNVWYACYTITIIILFVMYVIIMWEIRSKHYFEDIGDSRNLLNYDDVNVEFSDICLLQLGVVSQQGVEIEPKSYSGRIATFTILLSLMFLYTSYSANIVALLQSTSDSIRTVNDLLESTINLGAEDVVYNHYHMSRAQDPLRRELYLRKVAPPGQRENFFKLEDGIRKLQTEFFAFHSDVSPCYEIIKQTFQEHEKCSLREINFLNMKFLPCLPLVRNSSYKELLEIASKKVWESGISDRIIERLSNKKPRCVGQGSSFMSVGLQDSYFAFVMFGLGMALSLILLLLERIFRRYERSIIGALVRRKERKTFEHLFK